jgi:hypothetical protein
MASFSPYQKLTSIAATEARNIEPTAGQVVIHDLGVFISNLGGRYREDRAKTGNPIATGFSSAASAGKFMFCP